LGVATTWDCPSQIPHLQEPPTSSSTVSPFPRKATDYSQRLPAGWEKNTTAANRAWIGRELFAAKVNTLRLWRHPPPVDHAAAQPSVENYTCKRLFLWMPREMWRVGFSCPRCKASLHSKGPYNRVWLVLDMRDMLYYFAGVSQMFWVICFLGP
jgi:hypothetical protein